MELTLADIERLLAPIYTILNSIDKRMGELESSQKELSNELKRATDRYYELDRKIGEVEAQLAGFIDRYQREHQILEESVKRNYSDLKVDIQNCKPETIADEKEKKRSRFSSALTLALKIVAIFSALVIAVAVVVLTLNEKGFLKREGVRLTIPNTERLTND